MFQLYSGILDQAAPLVPRSVAVEFLVCLFRHRKRTFHPRLHVLVDFIATLVREIQMGRRHYLLGLKIEESFAMLGFSRLVHAL